MRHALLIARLACMVGTGLLLGKTPVEAAPAGADAWVKAHPSDTALYMPGDIRGRLYRIAYTGYPEGTAPKATPRPSNIASPGNIAQSDSAPPKSDTADLPVPESSSPDMIALGYRIFHGQEGGASCASCHGASATGSQVGPDLTKQKYLWTDGSFAEILKVITDGVPKPKQFRRPMPPMGGVQLSKTQLSAVAAYVWALSHKSASPVRKDQQ
ncbi:MAG TPA: c-type cytochrome [Candidatus Sulfotelmatobacter sp.]|jgi:mono/diheme cytochrome c family protein